MPDDRSYVNVWQINVSSRAPQGYCITATSRYIYIPISVGESTKVILRFADLMLCQYIRQLC